MGKYLVGIEINTYLHKIETDIARVKTILDSKGIKMHTKF